MLTIAEVVSVTDPKRTVLFFGAGASIPCGAPSGAALAEIIWKHFMKVPADSSDLIEVSSILEKKFGRAELIKYVRQTIRGLKPVGRIQDLPYYEWLSIYTTNYDTLVEQAYAAVGKTITTVVSNYDFGRIVQRQL